VSAPVWIVPGLAEETVAVHFGPGRRRAGRVGNGSGFDAYPLRTSDAFAGAASVALRKTGARFPLACTQGHFQLEGRDLVRVLPLEEARHAAPAEPAHAHVSLFPPREAPGPAWGMSIDLGACTGCSACVVACQAENNIPTVGKAEVLRHREMHWLRIDRWYEGDPARPRILHQPVPCMHCEQAPCEPVCPVGATTHSPDGLNEMTYNRCVGTRYCSNNCPYKVRRFNFFPFAASDEPLARLLQNPDVTVRGRGVMEKCTYCVQRPRPAGLAAAGGGRARAHGDVVTACQQSCPTEAIVFGDLKLLESRVARRRASGRSYALLADLGTRPRTTYLARAVHPNPELGA
jgi:molybdopterin-containing oxidoreductase family iron-sulfur binding subunit